MPRIDAHSDGEAGPCPLCGGKGIGTGTDGLCSRCGGSGVVKIGKGPRRAASMESPSRIRGRPAEPGLTPEDRDSRQRRLLTEMTQAIRSLEESAGETSPAVTEQLRALRIQVEHLHNNPGYRTFAAVRAMERSLMAAQQLLTDIGLPQPTAARADDTVNQLTGMLAELLGLAHPGR